MSQSRAAKHDSAKLQTADLLFAVLLHALVLIIVLVLAYWQGQHKQEPLKRIEVMMISAKQLAHMERQAHHPKKTKPAPVKKVQKKPAPFRKPVVKPRPTPKPVVKPAPVKKAKPITKPKLVKPTKPVAKAPTAKTNKPVKQVKAKEDPDFDPFAPVTSRSDIKKVQQPLTRRPDLADIAGKQLSTNEKERYIAMMQAAVQEHWKVPLSTATQTDPLVGMELLPNGEVASVRILESSGNELLDASLIRAIHAAAPFQLPAKQFEYFRNNKLRFHPMK